MSQALAVAARELRERWLLFPGGLALGFVPLILPAFSFELPADAPPTVGLFVAVLLGTISAVVIGSSMLARDAADGRLGFLFSRPIPWGAIWGGKWLAAIVLVTGSGALAALPWMVVYPPHPDAHAASWGAALLDPQGATFFVLLLLLGVGLANFGATAFRSRSPWLALDLSLLLVASWLAWRWVAPLYSLRLFWHLHSPMPMARWIFLLPMAPAATALVFASAAQTARGRTDIRRAHRAMSIAFWSVIFVTLAAAGLRLAWVRAATPADLTLYGSGSHDPSGRWLYADAASRRGGGAAFLIDTEGARHVSLGLTPPWEGYLQGMAFATDSGSAVILVHGTEHSELVSVDLTGDEPRFATVELEKSPPMDFMTRLVLSPSGARVLLAHDYGASLFETSSGRRVATATIPPGWRPAAACIIGDSKGRVWLIPSIGASAATPSEMRILEMAVGREATIISVPLASAVDPVRAWPDFVQPDASGRKVLTRDGGLHLRDGETGTLLATLVEGHAVSPGPYLGTRTAHGVFLADGRIVVGQAVGSRTVLHVFSPDGVPLDQLDLDRVPAGLAVGPEVAPGRVAVRFGSSLAGPETLVVDLAEGGRVVETLPGYPLRDFWRLGTPRATATSVHFFVNPDDGAIVRRDFTTGEQRVVAGTGAPVGERLELR